MGTPRIPLGPVWFVLPAMLTLIFVGTEVEYPLDFWHQVTTGHLIWQTGSLPATDTFTYTIAGRPIVNQNWLAQLAFYRLFDLGGYRLMQFLAGLCYAAALLVTTRLAWHRCGNVRVAAALAITALALAISNLGVRPQALSTLLFSVELFVLWRWPGRGWTVGAVACVELLWTNTHGAFPLGVALPGIFLLAAGWQRRSEKGPRALLSDGVLRCNLACVLASAAAMFCNPYPRKTIDYVLGVVSRAPQRHIGEWLPTALGTQTGIAYFASLAAVLLILGLRRRRLEPIELLLLVGFAILGGRAQRMVIWWALVMAPVLAPQVAGLLPSGNKPAPRRAERSSLNFAFLLLLTAATVMCTPWTRRYNRLLPLAKRQAHADDEPHEAVRFLQKADYGGPNIVRVFCPMEWGAYFTWFLRPKVKVFVDTRIDFFPDEVWEEYVRVRTAGRGWEEILAKYDVHLVAWNRQWSSPLPAALERSPRWKNIHKDQLATVFARCDEAPHGVRSCITISPRSEPPPG